MTFPEYRTSELDNVTEDLIQGSKRSVDLGWLPEWADINFQHTFKVNNGLKYYVKKRKGRRKSNRDFFWPSLHKNENTFTLTWILSGIYQWSKFWVS